MSCGSCGSDGGSCSTGCGKLDVHDWLGDMGRPMSAFDGVEVRFKSGRKEFYRNVHNLELYTGDIVVVESSPGHHVGEVTMQGEIVRLQLKKKKIEYNDDLNIIYRKATSKDVDKFEQARNRELTTLYRTREVIQELKLGMKLSDVEYQADNSKATFYYSAEERVDFRELIKVLATEFKIRVEMKQISLRQEASRLGGIGSCGRELCCSSWLTDFKNVSTSAARYQNLSLNPAKLSGQCGRLKCCLNYELETYISSAKEMPSVKVALKTEQGRAFLQKSDIFKKLMWFGYEGDSNWVVLTVDRVNEILKLNEEGVKVYSLEMDKEAVIEDTRMNSDLLDLDKRLNKKNPSGNRNSKKKKKNNKRKIGAKNTLTPNDDVKSKKKAQSYNKSTKKVTKSETEKVKTDVSKQTTNTVKGKPSGKVRKRQNVQESGANNGSSPIKQGNKPQKVTVRKRQNVNTEKEPVKVKKTTQPKVVKSEKPQVLKSNPKIRKRQNAVDPNSTKS